MLFVAALVIAFGVVAAAGIFSFSSRRVDAGVLAVRGWGPGRMGIKAVLESALPSIVGAVAGFLVATATIAWLGPAGIVEPSARSSALVGSLLATVAIIALIGTVTAFAFASKHEPRAGLARLVMFLPWEILALAGAYVMVRHLRVGRRRDRHDDRTSRVGGVPVPVAVGAGRRDRRGAGSSPSR